MDNRIKESFDSLPVAVCFFDARGVVCLINHRMLAIAGELRQDGIQSLCELKAALLKPPVGIRCLNSKLHIYLFPDDTALRFDEEQLVTKAGKRYTQVTASDVTKLIREQELLEEENTKLTEANERMRKLFMQMPELIREKETLTMKQHVHDDIGHSILAARRALLNHASLDELKKSAVLWERSITILYRSNQMAVSTDQMEAEIRRASEMGVNVITDGEPPKAAELRKLAALAIRECAANCVRHANATRLYVSFRNKPEYTTMSLANNGILPKAEIREGGGLSMLRRHVEEAGGSMKVQSFPSFRLVLTFPLVSYTNYEAG